MKLDLQPGQVGMMKRRNRSRPKSSQILGGGIQENRMPRGNRSLESEK